MLTEQNRKDMQGYQLGAKIGEGTFGQVFGGVTKEGRLKVAVKIVDKSKINEKYVQMIRENQVERLRKIQKHPNIVQLIDAKETQGYLYIVFERCETDLDKLIQTKKTLKTQFTESECLFIIYQLLNACTFLWQSNIIHRDLKPANILINKQGVIKLADFGISKKIDPVNPKNTSKQGAPHYMSYEVMKGEDYTHKCDIWSLACVFYQLLHLGLPWDDVSEQDMVSVFQRYERDNKVLPVPRKGITQESINFIQTCLSLREINRPEWEKLWYSSIFKHYDKIISQQSDIIISLDTLITKSKDPKMKFGYSKQRLTKRSIFGPRCSNRYRYRIRMNKQTSKYEIQSQSTDLKTLGVFDQMFLLTESNRQLSQVDKLGESEKTQNQPHNQEVVPRENLSGNQNQIRANERKDLNCISENPEHLSSQNSQNLINLPLRNYRPAITKYRKTCKDPQMYIDLHQNCVKLALKDQNKGNITVLHFFEQKFEINQVFQYDFSMLKKIRLVRCQINDEGWRAFVQNAQPFEKLKEINIHGNQITTVQQGDLQSFQNLKEIMFSSKETVSGNPLTQDSENIIQQYLRNHSKVKVTYKMLENPKPIKSICTIY